MTLKTISHSFDEIEILVETHTGYVFLYYYYIKTIYQ